MSIEAYAATVRAIRIAEHVAQLDALAASIGRTYPADTDAALLLDLIVKKRYRLSRDD